MSQAFWSDMYATVPLEQIPWQLTRADWFTELLDKHEIHGDSALDVGCGTGMKSIELAQAGFKTVIGVDVVEKAIAYARANATNAGVAEYIKFVLADMSAAIPFEDRFDFVLDWATLHCIDAARRAQYVKNITNSVRPGGLLLLRVFAKERADDATFIDTVPGIATRTTIYLFDDAMIRNLYGASFDIRSKHDGSKARTKTGRTFHEYLMIRK